MAPSSLAPSEAGLQEGLLLGFSDPVQMRHHCLAQPLDPLSPTWEIAMVPPSEVGAGPAASREQMRLRPCSRIPTRVEVL